VRTFIALETSSEIKDRLRGFVVRLKRTNADVKWVEPPGMHLTLKFLGETTPGFLEGVEAGLAAAAGRGRRFALEVVGTGAFPPHSRVPRVLWVGVRADPALAELQTDVEAEMEKLGFPPEGRPFSPHLTLGRVKGPAGLARAMAELEIEKAASFGKMTVERLTLFQSTLRPQGAEYSILRELPLS
jgi:2'-5' RNA ligase